MDHYCSEKMGLVKDTSGNLHYVNCNEPATHIVPDSIYEEGYYLCDKHTAYAKYRKWSVEKL